ncbi:MAG: L-seryl-tRNA(Sec) selenium transferase [bacterium]|nr:L-seryl-tRNA(Sec) selenium transferase [bacterium]
MSENALRQLPSVGQLLELPEVAALARGGARPWVTRLVQRVVDEQRARLRDAGDGDDLGREERTRLAVAAVLRGHERALQPAMRRVINATGILVHTNLGRSLLPERAVAWAAEAARHNLDLETDLAANRRGHRGRGVETKLALLTGAADALVVNNNAAALWLAVRACAGANRVVLSRGEIVAIGGSFRLDEILREAGCELVEVGTTNRTRLQDYRDALRPGAVVLKVHRSNFVQQGFVEEVALRDLAGLCRDGGHVLIYDAGSGQLADLAAAGLDGHRTLEQDLADGPDLVTCSGDKLLGGGQAGLVMGRADLVEQLRGHPLRRALRVDKTTLAALDGTLSLYLEGAHLREVPTLAFLTRTEADLERMAADLLASLAGAAPAGWRGAVVAGLAQVGGGCSADASLPTRLVQWSGPREELESCHRRLRTGEPAVLARIGQDGLAFDLRALREDELPLLAAAVASAWAHPGPNPREAP